MKKQTKYWISALHNRKKIQTVSMLLSVMYKSFLQAYYLEKNSPVVSKENAQIKIDSFQGKARCR